MLRCMKEDWQRGKEIACKRDVLYQRKNKAVRRPRFVGMRVRMPRMWVGQMVYQVRPGRSNQGAKAEDYAKGEQTIGDG
jgi:hypothetical protein